VLSVLGVLLLALGVRAWNQAQMLTEAARYGQRTLQLTTELQKLMQAEGTSSMDNRVLRVNAFFNQRLVQSTDVQTWGVSDYWASPMEFFYQGQGDCEDFAIAKYYALVTLGVPAEKLRLVYVNLQPDPSIAGVAHMVLAYYQILDEEPYILDNLMDEVRLASYRSDLQPVYSFNSNGLWMGALGPEAGSPLTRLSPWRRVVARARSQGFVEE
jgi:predicted transglutaminase-like cysteine proteinase